VANGRDRVEALQGRSNLTTSLLATIGGSDGAGRRGPENTSPPPAGAVRCRAPSAAQASCGLALETARQDSGVCRHDGQSESRHAGSERRRARSCQPSIVGIIRSSNTSDGLSVAFCTNASGLRHPSLGRSGSRLVQDRNMARGRPRHRRRPDEPCLHASIPSQPRCSPSSHPAYLA